MRISQPQFKITQHGTGCTVIEKRIALITYAGAFGDGYMATSDLSKKRSADFEDATNKAEYISRKRYEGSLPKILAKLKSGSAR